MAYTSRRPAWADRPFDLEGELAAIRQDKELDRLALEASWEDIQSKYEAAAGARSTGVDLRSYVEQGAGELHVFPEGYIITNVMATEAYGLPVLSHWAPNSVRDGVALLSRLAKSDRAFAAAVLPDMAAQLQRLGWIFVTEIQQFWMDRYVEKHVMVTPAAQGAVA